MCNLFIYNGTSDEQSDYRLIVISNRDEYYHRATQNMSIWSKDPVVIGGRDMEVKGGGTWLGISPTYNKIGVLLNIPGDDDENAISRGKIVTDYITNNEPVQKYVENLKTYTNSCNGFVFVSVAFGGPSPTISSFNNVNNELKTYKDSFIGFGNSLPDAPFRKVVAGTKKLQDICKKFKKENKEKELKENILALLKSEERYLPDQQLEAARPESYQDLSSIYICVPEKGYGTRTHTIVLLTKKGRLNITEVTQQMPINPKKPIWEKTEFKFDINFASSACKVGCYKL